jgi:RNA polymerase sigma factor (TIGR02999 family)
MRQVLVSLARQRRTLKRGGGQRAVQLSDSDGALDIEMDSILALDDALTQLETLDRRLSRVVELRFFGGLPDAEVAELLGVSARTVERDWTKARAFLLRELDGRSQS